jgi:HEAT repeat protein
MALSSLERDRVEACVLQPQVGATELRAMRVKLADDLVELVQRGAREHPNARVRRECLNVLDHHANDESSDVFRAALFDPVPHVRVIALHGLACERCRVGALCASDVVTDLIQVLGGDPNPKVRHGAVLVIARLMTRDARVVDVLARVAREDFDPLVRQVALAVVEGRGGDVRSRKALRRREVTC